MTNRRTILLGLGGLMASGLAAGTALASNTFGRVIAAGRPKLIKGKPNKVDFGHGLLVPMDKTAFETLWEGDDRWMAYGHGFGQSESAAMGQAELAAIATMKLFLITLAFAPERLVHVDGGGWKLKSGKAEDLIRGDVDLPGRPIMPTTDHVVGGPTDDSDQESQDSTHATTGWVVWKTEVTLDSVRRSARLVTP